MSALRQLSVEQQVGLLFVTLFGALFLATAVIVVRSLVRPGPRMDRLKRELLAVWVGTLVFWLAWMSGPVGATLLCAVRKIVQKGVHRLLAQFS